MTTPVLSRSELSALVTRLASEGTRVIAPVPAGGSSDETEYHSIGDLEEAELAGPLPRRSLKEFFRPAPEQRENLARQVVLGARPCDAAGVDKLDRVMRADYRDEGWLARRDATTIVSLACPGADGSCFCSAVGLGPDSTRGADALLVPLDAVGAAPYERRRAAELMRRYVDVYLHDCEPFSGAAELQGGGAAAGRKIIPPERYLARALTSKGEALLDGWGEVAAGAADLARAAAFARSARERVAQNLSTYRLRGGERLPPELEAFLGIAAADGGELAGGAGAILADVPEWLARNPDHELWTPLASRCRGCGTCSAVCSSSPCFDEAGDRGGGERGPFRRGGAGRRRRGDDLKQRVMHKFSVSPRRFDGVLCSGCGRCARRCEAGVKLPEVLGQIVQLARAPEGSAR